MNYYQKAIEWQNRTEFVQGISYKWLLIHILLSACIYLFLSFLCRESRKMRELLFETENAEKCQSYLSIYTSDFGTLIHNTSFSSLLMNCPNKLVLCYSRLEMLVKDKQSSLLDPFVSYEINEVLRIRTQRPILFYFAFFHCSFSLGGKLCCVGRFFKTFFCSLIPTSLL